MHRSRDGGESWSRVRSFGRDSANALAVDLRDPARVFVGTEAGGVMVSSDGGADWHALNLNAFKSNLSGTEGPQMTSIAVGGGAHPTVWAASRSDGLFKSTDSGASWHRVGFRTERLEQVLSDSRDGRVAYLVTDSGTVEYTKDGGRTWKRSNLPSGIWQLAQSQRTHYLYASWSGSIAESRNGGKSWRALPAVG